MFSSEHPQEALRKRDGARGPGEGEFPFTGYLSCIRYPLDLITTCQGRRDCPCFTDADAEAQRGSALAWGHTAQKDQAETPELSLSPICLFPWAPTKGSGQEREAEEIPRTWSPRLHAGKERVRGALGREGGKSLLTPRSPRAVRWHRPPGVEGNGRGGLRPHGQARWTDRHKCLCHILLCLDLQARL